MKSDREKKEHCGVFAILGTPEASLITRIGL